MVTIEQLEQNGFVYEDSWNNRDFYTKKGFDIVEHNGDIYRVCNDEIDFDQNFETIEELNFAYESWRVARADWLQKELKKLL